MVVEADNTSDLPYPIFVLPELNELRLTDRLGIVVSGMVEAVNTDLHRAIVGNGVYLKRPRNEFSGHLATDVVLYSVNQSLPSAAQAGLVVIELQVVGPTAIRISPNRNGCKRRKVWHPATGSFERVDQVQVQPVPGYEQAGQQADM